MRVKWNQIYLTIKKFYTFLNSIWCCNLTSSIFCVPFDVSGKSLNIEIVVVKFCALLFSIKKKTEYVTHSFEIKGSNIYLIKEVKKKIYYNLSHCIIICI